jgi:hypothetical protein
LLEVLVDDGTVVGTMVLTLGVLTVDVFVILTLNVKGSPSVSLTHLRLSNENMPPNDDWYSIRLKVRVLFVKDLFPRCQEFLILLIFLLKTTCTKGNPRSFCGYGWDSKSISTVVFTPQQSTGIEPLIVYALAEAIRVVKNRNTLENIL